MFGLPTRVAAVGAVVTACGLVPLPAARLPRHPQPDPQARLVKGGHRLRAGRAGLPPMMATTDREVHVDFMGGTPCFYFTIASCPFGCARTSAAPRRR